MSHSTEQIITAYFACFNANDAAGMLNLLHEDVVHDVNQGIREIGKDSFRSFLKLMDHHYTETSKNLAVMVDKNGQRAAAEFHIDGVYKVTAKGLPAARSQPYSLPVGSFFEMKDGKIKRVTTYYNLSDWIRQVQ